jgi:hypothetical protein
VAVHAPLGGCQSNAARKEIFFQYARIEQRQPIPSQVYL